MQIVIDINEEDYTNIKNATNSLIENGVERASMSKVCLAILDGVVIPSGHGDIIDRDELAFLTAIHDAKFEKISWSDAIRKIKYSAPTIVKGVV